MTEHHKKISKVESSIELTRRVSACLQSDADSARVGKRVSRKSSQDERPVAPSQDAPPALRVVPMTYKRTRPWPSRSYAVSTAVQSLDQLLQEALAPHTCDLDIVSAMFSIIVQMIDRLQLTHRHVYDNEIKLITRLAFNRGEICRDELKVIASEGKELLFNAFCGASIATDAAPILLRVQEAGRFYRWLAISIMEKEFVTLLQEPEIWAEASVASHLWMGVEDFVIWQWTQLITQHRFEHLSLHFDGIRVDRVCVELISSVHQGDEETTRQDAVAHVCELSTKHIMDRCGYTMRIRQKNHQFLEDKLTRLNEEHVHDSPASALLKCNGNCIYLALARLTGRTHECEEIIQQLESHIGRRDTGVSPGRSYGSCAEKLNIRLLPNFKLPNQACKLLLHCETRGSPHCLAVQIGDGDVCSIWNRDKEYRCSANDLNEMMASSLDKKLIYFFLLADELRERLDGDLGFADLTELYAATGFDIGDPEDTSSEEGMEPEKEGCGHGGTYTSVRDSEDGSIIFVHRDLEQRLGQEVNAEKKRIRRFGLRGNLQDASHRRCHLCPFFAASESHWRARLLWHIERHHAQTKFKANNGALIGTGVFVASGTKQLKIIKALYDDDSLYDRMDVNSICKDRQTLYATPSPDCQPQSLSRWTRA